MSFPESVYYITPPPWCNMKSAIKYGFSLIIFVFKIDCKY